MNLASLLALDRDLFFAINQLPHTRFLNAIGILFSAGSGFIWFFLIALFLFIKKKRLGAQTMIALFIAGALTHLFVLIIFKPLIARPRPDFSLDQARIIINTLEDLLPLSISIDYAFPSGHATMAFAGAYILSSFIKKKTIIFYLLATGVALSRIYLGKHYPSDIVAGVLLGLVVGWMAIKITSWVERTYTLQSAQTK